MIIKYIEPTDNLHDYLACVAELNGVGVKVSSVEEIKSIIDSRPTNILTFVGVINDRIVATATIVIEKKLRYAQLCCHIEDVGVHPEFRNKGYGKKMVEYCIDIAKRNKCYKIKLHCNDSLVSFYNKIGFQRSGNSMVMG